MYRLTVENEDDWWEVESLYDLCFAPGREALSSYRLRDGVRAVCELSLVARDDLGVLSGAIRYWPVDILNGTSRVNALLLGPVAVHPTRQGEGLGMQLINDSLQRARDLQMNRVMLVGDAPYYSRFGFSKVQGVVMPPPTNPERVLGYHADGKYWEGVVGHVVQAQSAPLVESEID